MTRHSKHQPTKYIHRDATKLSSRKAKKTTTLPSRNLLWMCIHINGFVPVDVSLTTERKTLCLLVPLHTVKQLSLSELTSYQARKQKFRQIQLNFGRTINFCVLFVSLVLCQQGGLVSRNTVIQKFSPEQGSGHDVSKQQFCFGVQEKDNTPTTSIELAEYFLTGFKSCSGKPLGKDSSVWYYFIKCESNINHILSVVSG